MIIYICKNVWYIEYTSVYIFVVNIFILNNTFNFKNQANVYTARYNVEYENIFQDYKRILIYASRSDKIQQFLTCDNNALKNDEIQIQCQITPIDKSAFYIVFFIIL